jgi:hypothetical protein
MNGIPYPEFILVTGTAKVADGSNKQLRILPFLMDIMTGSTGHTPIGGHPHVYGRI